MSKTLEFAHHKARRHLLRRPFDFRTKQLAKAFFLPVGTIRLQMKYEKSHLLMRCVTFYSQEGGIGLNANII